MKAVSYTWSKDSVYNFDLLYECGWRGFKLLTLFYEFLGRDFFL